MHGGVQLNLSSIKMHGRTAKSLNIKMHGRTAKSL